MTVRRFGHERGEHEVDQVSFSGGKSFALNLYTASDGVGFLKVDPQAGAQVVTGVCGHTKKPKSAFRFR